MFDTIAGGVLPMFDEFFYRRRKNKALFLVMIGLVILGIALFTAGIIFFV